MQHKSQMTKLALDVDWRPLSFSSVGDFDASKVVFAGYGITAPSDPENAAYDSFAGLDVKDKWVMVLRFMPEGITAERRQYLAAFSTIRDKARCARDLARKGSSSSAARRHKFASNLSRCSTTRRCREPAWP